MAWACRRVIAWFLLRCRMCMFVYLCLFGEFISKESIFQLIHQNVLRNCFKFSPERAQVHMRKWIIVLASFLAFAPSLLGIDTLSLTPTFVAGDGQFTSTTINGQVVWQSTNNSFYLYFDVPSTFTFTTGMPVYVQVVYYDTGYGTLRVQYDSTYSSQLADKYHPAEAHTRSSRVNSQSFVTSYQQLLKPLFANNENNGTDFRLVVFSTTPPLSVKSVTIQNTPFADTNFLYVLTKPWLAPYSGPTQDYVTNNTLNHKVMVGYQGWFRAPNDLSDQGWVHWCRTNDMQAKDFTVDMWPALSSERTNLSGFWPGVTAFPSNELFQAQNVLTRSGRQAYLFSSTTKETVRRHFQWMRQYNMDGAFLQRFASPTASGAYGYDEWVLAQVREAAHQEGRIWAIEYDISSLVNSNVVDVITNDWKWLCDVVGVRDDSRYAHENGKPVIFIWGLPFSDRNIAQSNGNFIVDWFHTNSVYGGNYVIGGVPNTWRSMTTWLPHFQKYDGIQVWQSTASQGDKGYSNDVAQCNTWGIDYFPHVWPGFSWANLMKQTGTTQLTPRQGGAFYWNQLYLAEGSSATLLFIGMFDEYDEGTAIMPMTDDPPTTSTNPTYGRFITNENYSVDWWMTLTSEARDMLLKQRPYVNTNSMPTEASTTNRANIGSQAWIDLGTTNQSHSLYLMPNAADGNTLAETLAGRDCLYNANPTNDHYFYFHVDPSYAFQAAGGLDVTIDVEYYDRSNNVTLDLQYNGTNGVYTVHPKQIQTQGSSEWRTVRYNIADAYFGGRQNGGADFRLNVVDNLAVHLDRIWVTALPLLGLSTTNAIATELGTNSASIIISRIGDTNTDVTARFTIGGTASNGQDYAALPSSVVIPAGVGSATVTVTPIPNNIAKGNRTLTFTLLGDLTYSIGTTNNTSVTIQDYPFDLWLINHFTAAELTNSAINSATADPDNDGIPNLMEYALNLDPKVANLNGLPVPFNQGGYLTLSFTRTHPAPLDLLYIAEVSNDLNTWCSNCVAWQVNDNGNGTETVTASDIVPINGTSQQFMRLDVKRLQ